MLSAFSWRIDVAAVAVAVAVAAVGGTLFITAAANPGDPCEPSDGSGAVCC